MEVETVTIKVPPSPGNEAGEVRINKSDFDPATMKLANGEQAPDPSTITKPAAPVDLETLNKAELIEYLDGNSVAYTASMVKAELLELAKQKAAEIFAAAAK